MRRKRKRDVIITADCYTDVKFTFWQCIRLLLVGEARLNFINAAVIFNKDKFASRRNKGKNNMEIKKRRKNES